MASVVQLTPEALRKIFPNAPQKYLDGIMANKSALDRAGVTTTRTRLAYCLANVEHECGGFTIKNLTENINYTHARAAQVWKNRFPGGAEQVEQKYGTETGKWQIRMLNDVYGGRMGNRPGTSDGSKYIGRGACQHTGRDGYAAMDARIPGLGCVTNPERAADANHQAQLIAAFWSWKNMNPAADAGNWITVVKRWNGGTNGLADREARLRGNDPVIARLQTVNATIPVLKELPGGPTPGQPPKDVVDEATKNEKRTQKGGGVVAGGGGASEVAKPLPIPSYVNYALIGIGVVMFIVAVVLIANKVKRVKENWI